MGKQGAARRKPSQAGKIFLAVMTFLNLLLTLALAFQRRREIVHAIEGDGGVKLLVTQAGENNGARP